MIERLIRTDGCYIGIFDAASTINIPGVYHKFMGRAEAEASAQGSAVLPFFNQQWADVASRGELLSWIVLFDGVFKVVVEVLPASPRLVLSNEKTEAFLGTGSDLLSCPSGELIVTSLDNLGDPALIPIVVVDPGIYRVALAKNLEQEPDHWFLEDPSEYPGSDGADWSIRIQRDEPGQASVS